MKREKNTTKKFIKKNFFKQSKRSYPSVLIDSSFYFVSVISIGIYLFFCFFLFSTITFVFSLNFSLPSLNVIIHILTFLAGYIFSFIFNVF